MKVKTIRRVSYEIEHEGRTFELQFQPCDGDDPLIRVLPDGRVVVGYLSYDNDCENPLESCDAMGHIYDARIDASRESRQHYLEARGINENGERVGKPDPYGVLLDVYSHSGECWRVHGGGRFFLDERWDVSNCDGIWVPDDSCREHIEVAAAGALYECLILYQSHSKEIGPGKKRYWTTYGWHLANGQERKGYKTVVTAARAAAKAQAIAFDNKKFLERCEQEALVCAEQDVEQFNEWLSGACYGVCVEVFNEDNQLVSDEACWGYVGTSWAEEELSEDFERTVAHELATPTQREDHGEERKDEQEPEDDQG